MSLFDLEAKTIDGKLQKLDAFRGKTLLFVNVASKCGFTPQYTGLEALFKKYQDKGLVILGFPCDQFGHQEPGSEAEIQQFCSLNYPVSFPMFAKVEVNGDGAHPIYKELKRLAPGLLGTEFIKWNFTKFLVTKDGQTVRRFASNDKPEDMDKDIAAVL
jgi:glutathione peroxidase